MNNETATAISPTFRGQVVQKIYRVWLVRKFLPVLLVEIAVLAFLLYELGKFVFVEKIVINASKVFFSSPTAIVSFITVMFTKTPLALKLLGIGVAVFVALILRQLTQGILRFILVKQNYFSKIKTS